MHTAPEAFMLISLPDASFGSTGAHAATGDLYLECVSMPNPDSKESEDRNVYLVLKVHTAEAPIDPASVVRRTDGAGKRVYTFAPAQPDQAEMTLTINLLRYNSNHELLDKLEAFESILEQYVTEYHGPSSANANANSAAVPPTIAGQSTRVDYKGGPNKDFRGQLVMVNEDTGEVVGEVEDRFRIKEDPIMHQKGHESDPVIIEVGDEDPIASDANALEAFARIVPPEQRNWITSSANVVSHAISMTTNLLLTTITTASSLYISHSAASPHHPNSSKPITGTTSKDGSASSSSTPPPLPPRALVFLTSEKTRKNLSTVHAYSGQAVKVSAHTVGLIDKMIRRAIGANPKRTKYFANTGIGAGPSQLSPSTSSSGLGPGSAAGGRSAPPTRTPSPSPSSLHAPPPYAPRLHKANSFHATEKPPLPPRRSPSPMPMPTPSSQPSRSQPQFAGTGAGAAGTPPPLPARLSTKDHILISADLILSTIDHSTRKVLDTGTEQIGRVMGHKYGPEAAQSSLLMASTARNVGLVYVDMRGIGRRALLKRAGKNFVQARVAGKNAEFKQAEASQTQAQAQAPPATKY